MAYASVCRLLIPFKNATAVPSSRAEPGHSPPSCAPDTPRRHGGERESRPETSTAEILMCFSRDSFWSWVLCIFCQTKVTFYLLFSNWLFSLNKVTWPSLRATDAGRRHRLPAWVARCCMSSQTYTLISSRGGAACKPSPRLSERPGAAQTHRCVLRGVSPCVFHPLLSRGAGDADGATAPKRSAAQRLL